MSQEQKTYASNGELIQDLVDADRDNYPDEGYINISNFSGAFYKGDLDPSNFWYSLLERLADPTKSPILSQDFKDIENHSEWASVFSFINDKADLDDDTVWNKVTHDPNDPSIRESDFWNESLKNLIHYFINNLSVENGRIRLKDNVYIDINDIRDADAANSFKLEDGPYVRPNINIDNQSYTDVRGADAIQSVLKNSSDLQFIRDAMDDYWTRLIMPKYLRKVEVEDLNRNFWVIAQTLSAVTAFLFGDDSIKTQFQGILNELVGLWENVLYLWALGAMISQKDIITDIHIEFVPLTNSTFQDYRKLDDFGNTAPLYGTSPVHDYIEEVKSRLNYLIKQYTESNLIIIPEVRRDNYKHNYYSKVDYPGLMVYNRNTNETIWYNFTINNYTVSNQYPCVDLKQDFNASQQQWCSNIIGIMTNENENKYYVISPFSNNQTNSPYYAAIRTILSSVNAIYDSINNIIKISNLVFNFYDAAYQAIDGTEHLIRSFNFVSIDHANHTITLNATTPSTPTWPSEASYDISRGFYLGELISCQTIVGQSSYTFNFENYAGQQLFASDPEQITGMIQEA